VDQRDTKRQKRFSLWSDILLEEELNHSVSNSMDIKKSQMDSITQFDRKSENYSFWTKRQLEDNCDQQLTQKSHISDNKPKNEKKTRKTRNKIQRKSDRDFVSQIAYKLKEPKVHLLKRVCERIGQQKTSELCSATLDVESSGGLMTVDGKRRRTSGGVFFQLLKSDTNVTKEDIDFIFLDERQQHFKNHKKLQLKPKPHKKSLKRRNKRLENDSKCVVNMDNTGSTQPAEPNINSSVSPINTSD